MKNYYIEYLEFICKLLNEPQYSNSSNMKSNISNIIKEIKNQGSDPDQIIKRRIREVQSEIINSKSIFMQHANSLINTIPAIDVIDVIDPVLKIIKSTIETNSNEHNEVDIFLSCAILVKLIDYNTRNQPLQISFNNNTKNQPPQTSPKERTEVRTSNQSTQILSTRFFELKMLVESTYIKNLEKIKENPRGNLSDEQIEAIFKRPNVYGLHSRTQPAEIKNILFNYETGESIFGRVAQLYLCVNIEIKCNDQDYQSIINTISLAVMKRRLQKQNAIFTLRELRYEHIDDTTRVKTGKDNI